jgi:hypothetical protein
MDPVSAILAATAAAAALRKASDDSAINQARDRELALAWRTYLDSRDEITADLRLQMDRALENHELPPYWEWGEDFDLDLDTVVPVAKAPYDSLYAVFAEDGYLISAHRYLSHARQEVDYRAQEDGVRRVEIYEVFDVPSSVGREILNPDSWVYPDGYAAAHALVMAAGRISEERLWWYDMYEDDEFDEWDMDAQDTRRDQVLSSLDTTTIPAGTTLYISDDSDWDLNELQNMDFAVLTDDMSAASNTLMDSGWRNPPRIIQVVTTDEIPLVHVLRLSNMYSIDDVEIVVGRELDEFDEFIEYFSEYIGDTNGFMIERGVDGAIPGAMLLVLHPDALENLELQWSRPLEGEFNDQGVRQN